MLQCHGNYIQMKIFKYLLEIYTFRSYSRKNWTSYFVFFEGLGVSFFRNPEMKTLPGMVWGRIFRGVGVGGDNSFVHSLQLILKPV